MIETIKTPSGQRRYNVESYQSRTATNKQRPVILYARVSSRAQQPDLQRQVATLASLYPQAEIVQEIGGGLNFKRKKLLFLLGRILSGDISMVVVAHKDRLARFGFDLFQWLCDQNNCKLLVLNQSNFSPEQEMVEDILAILHCFSSRLYGLRKYKTQIKEDKSLPIEGIEPSLEEMVSGG